jgi:predicted nucleotidyltransferase
MSIMTTISRHSITIPINSIAELCQRYGVRDLSVYGSLLGDDFRPGSNIDFLVVFGDGDLGPWMEKLLNMEEELRVMLGSEVDLVPKERSTFAIGHLRLAGR